MDKQNLIKAVGAAKIGYEVKEALELHAPGLLAERDKALEALSASYTSVEPASTRYWERALKLKGLIMESIKDLPSSIKASIRAYVIPTGFYH